VASSVERSLSSVYEEKRRRAKSAGRSGPLSHNATVKRVDRFYQESILHNFRLQSDEHAEPWGGTDKAPSPLGYLLSAIGFSINNQITIQSEVHGVKLDSLETVVTGWFDPVGCLDVSGHNPRLSKVALEFFVASGSPRAKIQKVLEKASLCDPAFQTLKRAAKVEMKLSIGKAAPTVEAGHGGHPGH